MTHIQSRRAGLIALAATVDDDRVVRMTWGLTRASAERRLLRAF